MVKAPGGPSHYYTALAVFALLLLDAPWGGSVTEIIDTRRSWAKTRKCCILHDMPESKGRVIGIGGVFLKSPDQQGLSRWYAENLGIPLDAYGGKFEWLSRDTPPREHLTAWSVFPNASTYFDPSTAPFMINYIVDDLDALLSKL
ncbi:MAG: hypothetical protein C5B51_18420, partial [Terriglobia bacterium]